MMFDRFRNCPMCDGRARFQWHPGTERLLANGSYDVVVSPRVGPDWMLRSCRDCGYTWPESLAAR